LPTALPDKKERPGNFLHFFRIPPEQRTGTVEKNHVKKVCGELGVKWVEGGLTSKGGEGKERGVGSEENVYFAGSEGRAGALFRARHQNPVPPLPPCKGRPVIPRLEKDGVAWAGPVAFSLWVHLFRGPRPVTGNSNTRSPVRVPFLGGLSESGHLTEAPQGQAGPVTFFLWVSLFRGPALLPVFPKHAQCFACRFGRAAF
jgi:hypothetical protein